MEKHDTEDNNANDVRFCVIDEIFSHYPAPSLTKRTDIVKVRFHADPAMGALIFDVHPPQEQTQLYHRHFARASLRGAECQGSDAPKFVENGANRGMPRQNKHVITSRSEGSFP
jgi:hypothetical protein